MLAHATMMLQRLQSGLMLALFSLALSGCYSTQTLRTLHNTELKGSPFQMTLAKLYRNFADAEAEDSDWKNSAYFAQKGLLVATGHEVLPEDPTKWNIPMGKRKELSEAREKLLNALKEPATTNAPEASAGVQFLYDCWVEQQEEYGRKDDLADCRDQFNEALADLEALQKTEAEKPAQEVAKPAPAPSPASAPQAPMTLSTSYLVFFEWARSDLTKDGKKVVADVIADLKSQKTYQIVLNGHTDTSGPEDFNLELSQKRAEMVEAVLLAGGIPKDRMTLYAFGESDPRVPTGDGVKEQMNRRVEIFINP